MLSPTQAATMLELQRGMNAKVHPDWLQKRYPYLLAVVIEGAEAIDHHGWKWWKKQDKDLPQLQMELIDVWHFLLSEILLRSADTDTNPGEDLLGSLKVSSGQASIAFDGKSYDFAELDLLRKLELLVGLASVRRIELGLFESIMADCELDWTALFLLYIGKNVLNIFRQDNGYKEGTYRKMWNGREDNECLMDIIRGLKADDADTANLEKEIYRKLKAAYPPNPARA